MILIIFSPKNLERKNVDFHSHRSYLGRKMIKELVFKKNFNFLSENLRKSLKIVIIIFLDPPGAASTIKR
jgi:hypothetical protein